ncbi:hypothetical protein [Nocardioides perillae]|uniref:Uncharacterized protein n=1 Tax=Nocardioides perillae TaxID=1119534 RepID=A0A7Y9UK44_9ACTN|nr:hypothetical protein [Nocardioides perillae]NYG54943.1 hypothetical protein [Nocardioides perillae]
MARVRDLSEMNGDSRPHPTEVDCGWQVLSTPGGARLLQLSTYGSDTRVSHPKVSQTIQLDRAAALRLREIIDATFGF